DRARDAWGGVSGAAGLKSEQAAQHLPRTFSCSGAEEHPGDQDGKEGDCPRQSFRSQAFLDQTGPGVLVVGAPGAPEMIDAEIDAVQAGPDQAIPAGDVQG